MPAGLLTFKFHYCLYKCYTGLTQTGNPNISTKETGLWSCVKLAQAMQLLKKLLPCDKLKQPTDQAVITCAGNSMNSSSTSKLGRAWGGVYECCFSPYYSQCYIYLKCQDLVFLDVSDGSITKYDILK